MLIIQRIKILIDYHIYFLIYCGSIVFKFLDVSKMFSLKDVWSEWIRGDVKALFLRMRRSCVALIFLGFKNAWLDYEIRGTKIKTVWHCLTFVKILSFKNISIWI